MTITPAGHFDEIVGTLGKVAEAGSLEIERIRPDDLHGLYLSLLHMSLLESGRAMHAVLKFRVFSTVPIILRSAVEIYVDFENLLSDLDYFDEMLYRQYNEQKRVLDNAKIMDSLATVKNHPEYNENLRVAVERLAELKNKGAGKKYKMSERLKGIPVGTHLWPIYWQTSLAVHSPIGELERRHGVKELPDGSITASIVSDKMEEESIPWCVFMAQFIVASMTELYAIIGHNDDGLSTRLFEAVSTITKLAGLTDL